jgi:hypothetical protein
MNIIREILSELNKTRRYAKRFVTYTIKDIVDTGITLGYSEEQILKRLARNKDMDILDFHKSFPGMQLDTFDINGEQFLSISLKREKHDYFKAYQDRRDVQGGGDS